MRYYVLLIYFLAIAGVAAAQEPAKPATEVTPDDTAREIVKALKDSYPPPLVGRIKFRIEKVSPVELLPSKTTKKPAGGQVEFDVMATNSDEKDFDFTPGNVVVQILDREGQEFPLNRYDWNESAHGDSGVYPIAQGKRAGRHVVLTFADEAINEESTYFIVANYIVLYPKPVPKYDMLTTVKVIEARGAKLRGPDKE